MEKVSDAERNLYEALRKYPVLIHKNFCLFHAGERGDDYFDIDRLTLVGERAVACDHQK